VNEQFDSIADFTKGDRQAARQLRTALHAIAEEHSGTPLATRIQATLTGRISMRELAEDPDFLDLTRQGARKFEEEWAALDPDEKATFTDQATRELDQQG
jgi:hypothetical protein